MSLDDVVQLTITTQTVFPTRAGFGVPLLMALHTVTPALIAEYRSTQELTDAGFATTSPVYRAAQKVFSQNPKPAKLMVGKRTRAYTQTVRLIPVKTTEGYTYTFDVVDPAGVTTPISYTVPALATVASIVTALTALLGPVTDMVPTDAATHVSCATTAGKLVNYKNLPPLADMKVLDVTADPGIASDLADVAAIDSASWYGVCFDQSGEAEINAAAAWIEAVRKIALFNTSDSQCADPVVTTDIGSDLKAAAYARSALLFNSRELLSYSAAAWMARILPLDPGATTWAYATLKGITVDTLTGGQQTALQNKRINFYTVLGGLNVTQYGITPAGEWLDVTHFVDWLYARTQERIFGTIAAASAAGRKIPYTDAGVAVIVADIRAQLADGISRGGLAADPAPTVTAPKVADVDPAMRAARILPDVTFQATLAGAIHQVKIAGTLSV